VTLKLREYHYTVIPADSSPPFRHSVAMSDPPRRAEVKMAVEPHLGFAPMQQIPALHPGGCGTMFIDGFGEDQKLPLNSVATHYYHNVLRASYPNEDMTQMPKVHGAAVLFDEKLPM
jgi:hypothetical protein